METSSGLFATLFATTPPNIVFTVLILILTIGEIFLKRDFKGQIVSVGVLGTFVGIFIGLQHFDPESMKNSVHNILIGLKTAFATSIFGMSSAIFLSIYQKIRDHITGNSSEDNILFEIDSKLANIDSSLTYLPRLDNTALISKLDEVVRNIREREGESRSKELEAILKTLIDIKNQNTRATFTLQEMLSKNFEKLNQSMEEATKQLSRGATEEIIQALERVISDFNSNLTKQFGGNFEKLNEAVFELVNWQEKYKDHISDMEKRLEASTSSIEKVRESILEIAEANEKIGKVYSGLSEIVTTSQANIRELQNNLDVFSKLLPNIENVLKEMDREVQSISKQFKELSTTIENGNSLQKESFEEMNRSIVNAVSQNGKFIQDTFAKSMEGVVESFKLAYNSLERQRYEINVITNHFKIMGEQIPEALRVSLDELNKGLTQIITRFQKDYEEVLYRHKENIDEASF